MQYAFIFAIWFCPISAPGASSCTNFGANFFLWLKSGALCVIVKLCNSPVAQGFVFDTYNRRHL